jgi:hypothetical protein
MESVDGVNTTTAGITIGNGISVVQIAGRESRYSTAGRAGSTFALPAAAHVPLAHIMPTDVIVHSPPILPSLKVQTGDERLSGDGAAALQVAVAVFPATATLQK